MKNIAKSSLDLALRRIEANNCKLGKNCCLRQLNDVLRPRRLIKVLDDMRWENTLTLEQVRYMKGDLTA